MDTYLRIVQRGAPDEIDRFSKIERQKLVELLCTNQDLLNHIFDTMFVTKTNDSDGHERPMGNGASDQVNVIQNSQLFSHEDSPTGLFTGDLKHLEELGDESIDNLQRQMTMHKVSNVQSDESMKRPIGE